jgi:hypothetical protein
MQNVIVAGKTAGGAETSCADGDGQWVSHTVGGSITTTYAFGVYEKEGTIERKYGLFDPPRERAKEGYWRVRNETTEAVILALIMLFGVAAGTLDELRWIKARISRSAGGFVDTPPLSPSQPDRRTINQG